MRQRGSKILSTGDQGRIGARMVCAVFAELIRDLHRGAKETLHSIQLLLDAQQPDALVIQIPASHICAGLCEPGFPRRTLGAYG